MKVKKNKWGNCGDIFQLDLMEANSIWRQVDGTKLTRAQKAANLLT